MAFLRCAEYPTIHYFQVTKACNVVGRPSAIYISTNYLYNEIGLETLKTRRDRSVLLFVFKIMHNMVPGYLQELKPEKQKQGRYMFRNTNDLAEPNWRITKYRKSFLPFAVSLWNKLEETTRTITNYELFKDTLMRNINDNPYFL